MGFMYTVSKNALWLWSKIWLRCSAEGLENIPAEGPVVFASNHCSHLDPLMMGIMAPRRVSYVARSSLGKIPLVGLWMRSVGTVFIDRNSPGRQAIGKAIERLGEGEVVGMFPEGTRSKDGRVHEFQKGLLLLLKKSQARVVPIGIRGTFAALPPGSLFPRPRRCSVHYGPMRSADEVLADGGLEALRRDIAVLSGSETD